MQSYKQYSCTFAPWYALIWVEWEAGLLIFWSSLSWLSGSLTTFRWLSKNLPVGFGGSQFEAESCIFDIRTNCGCFWYFSKYTKIRTNTTAKTHKTLPNTYDPQKKYQKHAKLTRTKTYQNTNQKLHAKNLQTIENTITAKNTYKKHYDPRKNYKHIQICRNGLRNQILQMFHFADA